MPKSAAPPPRASSATDTDADLSYEAALHELEALVARMDSGQLPLDDLLAGYQRGAALLSLCRAKLAVVEQQIRLLDAKTTA